MLDTTLTVREVRLGEVADFIRGITFKPEDVVARDAAGAVLCMRTKNVQADLDLSDVWGIPAHLVKRREQVLQAGDILVSSANSWNLVGKCCWIPDIEAKATFGGFVSVLRGDPSRIDRRYLYRWFASEPIQAKLRTFGRKTTNISNLDFDRSLDLMLRLPPIEEQRRIAAILDQADALRAKRRAALAQLDEMARAIFVEMFGDPTTHLPRFPLTTLGSLGSLDRGVSKHRPRNAPELLGGPYPFIQTGDVSNCDGYIHTYKATYSEIGFRQSKMWPAGTLCITIAANIARVGILTFDACFPDSIVGFRAADPATSEYVRVWFAFMQEQLEQAAPESTQKNINLEILRTLRIASPPISLQREFAAKLIELEGLRSTAKQSSLEASALFTSLQHRAFRGEL